MPIITLLVQKDLSGKVFPPELIARLHTLGTLIDARYANIDDVADQLGDTEYLVGTWGMPVLDATWLARLPRLRGVFYGAGSVKGFVTDALWERDIVVSSAAPMNAIPVAEYTFSMIMLSNKGLWQVMNRPWKQVLVDRSVVGNHGAVVGIIGASLVGRATMALLRHTSVRMLLADPYMTEAQARELGAKKVELPELMAACDVVSLHAPNLPSLRHMIDAELLGKMKDGATFINTARGALVNEDALIGELRTGRIWAVLDVTEPEPPVDGSPLYTLPNVIFTPHIAGPMGGECYRMADFAISELERHLHGDPLQNQVRREDLGRIG